MKQIKLTRGKYALVDDADFGWLSSMKWHTDKKRKTFYAAGDSYFDDGRRMTVYMHRVILKTPKGMQVDHRDGDGLNNQRSNIRNVTHSQNQQNKGKTNKNTSGYKGVHWSKQNKKWQSTLKFHGKLIRFGQFSSKEQAYQAYIDGCIKYHGEFANIG